MTADITPERRAELQEIVNETKGSHFVARPEEIAALLDAADERDRLAAEVEDLHGDAMTLRGYINTFGETPSMTASRATAAEATARQLAEALKLFRKAKAWLAADDYDDGPEMRRAFEFADSAADLALATPEVKALIETGT